MSKAALDETQIENKDRILFQERKQFETQLAREREVSRRLIAKNYHLQSKVDPPKGYHNSGNQCVFKIMRIS